MRRWTARVGLVVSLALAAACSGSSGDGGDGADEAGAATAEPEAYDGPDFYAEPSALPDGEHGTLIRYQPVDDLEVAGAAAYRIMYLSEDLGGEPIAVTGTALVPAGEAPEGGRRVLTVAHGTTGVADQCAPSKAPATSELALMDPFVDEGYVVAMSDYEGLGTAGRHPYLVGESEGRGVLDAATAALALPGADAGDELAIFGYSQGGHGALWAGQLAAEWAPDLRLVGTVAGAPATEIPVILSAGGSLPIAGFLYMIIAGFNDAYPEAALAAALTPDGEAALPVVDEACVADVIARFAGSDASSLLKPEGLAADPWAALATENNPGNVATDTPILVVHSSADRVVPAALSELMVQRMCGVGQVVERRLYETGQGHGEAVPDAVTDGFAWLEQRFAGDEPVSTCPTG